MIFSIIRHLRRLSGSASVVTNPKPVMSNRIPATNARITTTSRPESSAPVSKSSAPPSNIPKSASTRTPASLAKTPLPLLTPERLAQELLDWLRKNEHKSGLRYVEILRIYEQMCAEQGWHLRPWAPVARAFAKLTTDGRKIYRWHERPNAKFVRRRIYPFPTDAREPSTVAGNIERDVD